MSDDVEDDSNSNREIISIQIREEDNFEKEERVTKEEEVEIFNGIETLKKREDVIFWNIGILSLNQEEKIERIFNDLMSAKGDAVVKHNVLYNLIRSDNAELFEKVMLKWRSHNSDDQQFETELNEQLAEAFEELQIKNVSISDVMTYAVVEILINIQSLSHRDDQSVTGVDPNKRIKMVLEQIEILNNGYSDEHDGREVDEKFILVARFVAKNIRVLKRLLRFTYDKFPWEEIEFCLVAFIASETKEQDINFYYKAVLDKNRTLNHLVAFATKLSSISLSEIKDKKRLGNRTSVKKSILVDNNEFERLYNDFELTRDIYTLIRADRYIQLALEVDLENNFELGMLVVERALQVIGECLKNTLESPNLSGNILKIFSSLRQLQKIVTSLRDSLSHVHDLGGKLQIEDGNDLQFCKTLQRDIRKIHFEIKDALKRKKINAIKLITRKCLNCTDFKEIDTLRQCFKYVNTDDFDLSFTSGSRKIETLIDDLRKQLGDQPKEVVNLFDKIDNIIKHNISATATNDCRSDFSQIKKFLLNFDKMCFQKNMIQDILAMLTSMTQVTNIKDLDKITMLVREIFNKTAHSKNYGFPSVITYKLIFVDGHSVKAIDEFKENFDKKNRSELMDNVIKKIESYIITEKDKDVFRREVENRKAVYEHKEQLIKLLENTIKPDEPQFKEKYDFLIELTKFSKSQRLRLNQLVNDSNWKGCIEFISKMRDGYKTFHDSVTGQKTRNSKIKAEVFKDFVRSILRNRDDCVTRMLAEEENQMKIYFDDQLNLLNKILLQSHPGKESTVFDRIKSDHKLLAAVEMVTLNLLEVLENVSSHCDNCLFLDRPSPVLIGKQLRNYLAHGDALIDILPIDPIVSLACNAISFERWENNLNKKKEERVNNVDVISYFQNRLYELITIISDKNKMFSASQNGETDIVEQLVDSGFDIKARNARSLTALHLAAQHDRIEMIMLLLERTISVFIPNGLCYSLILLAAANGGIDSVKHLLQMMRFDLSVVQKKTLLSVCAGIGHLNLMLFFQKHGFLACLDKYGLLQLLNVAAKNGHADFVTWLLIYSNKKVTFCSEDYRKSLFHAAKIGDVTIVNMLLTKMTISDSAAEDESLFTPLKIASIIGHDGVVNVLLLKGVDANGLLSHSKNDSTPLHCAAKYGHETIVVALISSGAHVDAQDETGSTSLHMAALGGHRGVAEVLLRANAIIDMRSSVRQTPLHLAALMGHMDVVQLLLNNNASANSRDCDGISPLCCALIGGHSAIALVLLDHLSDVNQEDSFHMTPLCRASTKGDADVVSALLIRGAVVNYKDGTRRTPLHFAAFCGHSAIVDLLIAKGAADVNARDAQHRTPLHDAALNDDLAVCRVLLTNGADVNTKDSSGDSPLHSAASNSSEDVVSLLLDKVADVNAKNNLGFTPLHLAAKNGRNKVVNSLLKIGKTDINAVDNKQQTALFLASKDGDDDTILTLISNKKTLPNLTDEDKNTPLHVASGCGHKYAAMVLLKGGANVNAGNKEKVTPLHAAAIHDYSDICQVLLLNEAFIEAVDSSGCTPLLTAIVHGSFTVVRLLVEKGADISAKTNKHWSPLHMTAIVGHAKMALLLIKNGANLESLDDSNSRPLHIAVNKGCADVVQVLLDAGAMVDARAIDNYTALHLAVVKGDREVALTLLNNGATVDVVNSAGQTPLFIALASGYNDIAKLLLAHGASNYVSPGRFGLTPLHLAVYNGLADLTTILLAKGADVNAAAKKGFTPLEMAIDLGHVDIALALISNEASVQVRDVVNGTPLHMAAVKDQVVVVEALLAHRAEVDARTDDGYSALHTATLYGNRKIVSILLANEASVNAKCTGNKTALHFVAMVGTVYRAMLLFDKSADVAYTNRLQAALRRYSGIAQLLVRGGADATIKNVDGLIPFDLAGDALIAALIMSVTDISFLPTARE